MALSSHTPSSTPPEAPELFSAVLYVRTTPAQIEALDAELARTRASSPGRRCSRADVARELIAEALERRAAARDGAR